MKALVFDYHAEIKLGTCLSQIALKCALSVPREKEINKKTNNKRK